MAQRQVIISYHSERGVLFWPQYWNDMQCRQLIYHIHFLLKHGNPANFYWCCGLKEALLNYEFDRIRAWIAEHDYRVREIMCYDVRYFPLISKEEIYADYTTDIYRTL